MKKIHSHIISTPIAPLKVIFDASKLYRFTFCDTQEALHQTTPPKFIQEVENKIKQYFKGASFELETLFNVMQGTDFQIRVWHALTKIPFGKVSTYGELAQELNSAPRAVGQACKKNPFPILVPCHRVVGQQSLGGYAGKTEGKMSEIKSTLIKFEQNFLLN